MPRRRFLRGVIAVAAGATAYTFTGCGGGDNSELQDKSGLLAPTEDTSSKAVRGGIFVVHAGLDTAGFDGLSSSFFLAAVHNDFAYQRIVQAHKVFNRVKGEKLDGSVEPYAADSWEYSADGLQVTFHLRPDNGLDPRPPTNGRPLDAKDVVFSFERYRATAYSRLQLLNELNPDSPVLAVEALDDSTVVFKLARPSAALLQMIGFWSYLILQPREADGGFDPQMTMRGSGPWMLTDYQPSVSFSYRRNPNFYRKDVPYLDGIDVPIIPEYAQGLAQLKAGHLHWFDIASEDVLPTKREDPSLQMTQQDNFPGSYASALFSLKPDSAWRDERLRQALSMLIDRDLAISARYSTDAFAGAGLNVETRWTTLLGVSEPDWLDPREKDFGDAGKYFMTPRRRRS